MRVAAALVLFLAAALAGGLVMAQARTLPDDTERGLLKHVSGNLVTIDEKPMRVAPGGLIRNQANLIVVPAMLPREGALAEYVLDRDGMIFRAWLLTPDEATREKKKKSP
jgi:hypothetical protein